MLNGHGDDRTLFNKPVIADFSSNVYYNGMSPGLQQHLANCLLKINNYPEVNAHTLQQALANWHGSHVLVTNGATEAFYLIAHAYRGKSATIIVPAFAEYEDACRANDMEIRYENWAESFNFNTDLVWFGNPNNPTGAVMSVSQVQAMLADNPRTTFVVDEAYIDFTTAPVSMVPYLSAYPNLIIVKSLTKTYSIPGLRLGYLLASSDIIKRIQAYKMPWSVNALALEAGLYITKHSTPLPVDRLLSDAEKLIKQLRSIDIEVLDTNTTFFLCKLKRGVASELKAYLLNDHGLLIRDASNFRSLSPAHFRVASQRPEHNLLLVNAIDQWLS
jgi:threonine-phosphate decarboxylase